MSISKKLGLSLVLFLCLSSARAELVDEIKIKADYFPDREYTVGADLDENHLIKRIYFVQKNSNSPTFFTLEELAQPQTLFEIFGIKLVQIQVIAPSNPSSVTISMSYVENYLIHSIRNAEFGMNYNPSSQGYDVIDFSSRQIIHQARVVTNYASFPRIPVGIASIQTN